MQGLAVVLFVCCAAVIFFVLAGYPILLALRARRTAVQVRRARVEPSVSFILPVHNGAAFLADKLQSIFALDYPGALIEVIVLSDGSTDATDEIASTYPDRRVRFIPLPKGGKATALNRGITEARNEILVMTDVRQSLAPDSLRRLIECFADPHIGVVSGNLFIREGNRIQEADIGLYRRYEAWIRAQQSAFASVMGASGCYYAIRRTLAKPMPPNTLLDDVFLPLCAVFDGYRCILEPSARCFDLPTSLDMEFRRKVRTLAGVYQIIGQFPGVLAFWTSPGFHFCSLKLGRLVLPFAFIGAFASSFWLPQPWNSVALLPQVVFYATAAADLLIPEGSVIKRLTSPCRSFVVMMGAAGCAVSILFVPPDRLWKKTVVNNNKHVSSVQR